MTDPAPSAGTADRPVDADPRAGGRWARWLPRIGLLAGLSYGPVLLAHRGMVAADTKSYLYIDPARMLSRAWSLWDANVALGTVTHQNIGYLWPMGPWFWAFERLGVPDWVAQRLWLGTIQMLAGVGVLFLFRVLGVGATDRSTSSPRWAVTGATAAACIYMLSPYLLDYSARISLLLTPWAALPWLIALTQRALLRGGWRYPAIIALVVATAHGGNATALALVALGPLVWVLAAVVAQREVSWAEAARTVGRVAVLGLGVSAWWLVALGVQGRFGINILRYTETVETVATTSLASEVLRGLGYWLFYGEDNVGQWIAPGRDYTELAWLLAVGFTIPLLAMVAGVTLRWRYRLAFVAMLAVGVTVAVGAYPLDDPSPLGSVFKEFAFSSTLGLALRSTARAVPLVILALATLLGVGVATIARRSPIAGTVAMLAVVALAVANLPVIFTGDYVDENLERPEDLPDYWYAAAEHLDQGDDGTRVLELPGIDFASYRWGNTVDPITPGLIDRPTAYRELIPYGAPAAANLLTALDHRLQEGTLDPDALAPVSRLLGVGEVVIRNDLQYERYRTARPSTTTALLDPVPSGLDGPTGFGEPTPNRAEGRLAQRDEVELGVPDDTRTPAPVEVYSVQDTQGIVRVHDDDDARVLLAGDGEGVVDAAGAGVLTGSESLRYAASIDDDPAALDEALSAGTRLVLTDSNRRRAQRWQSVRDGSGYTERAGEEPLERDLSDARLEVFPGVGDDQRSVSEPSGGVTAGASSYGNPRSYTPELRPANAVDGDPATAWSTGAFSPVEGEYLQLRYDDEVATDRINVSQQRPGLANRWITRLTVRVDGRTLGTFDLTDESRTDAGQDLILGSQRFRELELVIAGDDVGPQSRYDGLSGVGLSEVRVAGTSSTETIRLPSALLDQAGSSSAGNALDIVLTRLRSDPAVVVRNDEEPLLDRTFSLPTDRRFTLGGTARLSARSSDAALDAAVGTTGTRTASSGRLPGDRSARSAAAIDGDPTTYWSNGFGEQRGAWIEVTGDQVLSTDHLDLTVVADGSHSVPTALGVIADGVDLGTVEVGGIEDGEGDGAVQTVRVDLGATVTARTIRLVILDVRPTTTIDYFSGQPIDMPVALAELGIPGARSLTPVDLPATCRSDLLAVDGRPIDLVVTGTTEAALRGDDLTVAACTGAELALGPGDHHVVSARGLDLGIDLDQLVLRSEGSTESASDRGEGRPEVRTTATGRSSYRVEVTGVDGPFWLVLGQSLSDGWVAQVDGGADLGAPVLVDGFANGWHVDPGDLDRLEISLVWEPQQVVTAGYAVSGVAVLASLALALVPSRRHRTRRGRYSTPLPPSAAHRFAGWRGEGGRPTLSMLAAVSVGLGLFAGVVAAPATGAVVAALAALGLSTPRGRLLLDAATVAAMGFTGAYVVAKELRYDIPASYRWPVNFGVAHHAAWLAVTLLVAHVIVVEVRRRAAASHRPEHQEDLT